MTLTDLQALLVEELCLAYGEDVGIKDLHDKLYGERELDNREMQQRLGPLITRTNKKLDGTRIEPGERKQTYRIINIDGK